MFPIKSPSGPPSPDAHYSPGRESANVGAIRDLVMQLRDLQSKIDPFTVTQILDANGNAYEVLARDLGTDASSAHQLALVNASEDGTAKVKFLAGIVSGGAVAETTLAVSDGDVQWVEFAVSYDTGTGSWEAVNTTRTPGTGASLPAESSSLAVCPIASVAVSDGNVTDIKLSGGTGTNTQDRYGPVFWQRPGGPDDFTSDFISPGP